MKRTPFYFILNLIFIGIIVTTCGQKNPSLPISFNSLRQIRRFHSNVPPGRTATLKDILIRFYRNNEFTSTSHKVREVKKLLSDPDFKLTRPTVLYCHGYVELVTDDSVMTVVDAYRNNGSYNILVLDWSNLAFGNYISAALDVKVVGQEAAVAVSTLIKLGLSINELHLVGHSLGAHLLAFTARILAKQGFKVLRLTGLDPAYPGFYPPLLNAAIAPTDAVFVDIVHTDGGGFGSPVSAGHVDFWPNGGGAKQPGCLAVTIPLTYEDFCSHWRSWQFWSESVSGKEFPAKRCEDYDLFLKGQCEKESGLMGLAASPTLRGNFYLRTAAKEPFSLGLRGVE